MKRRNPAKRLVPIDSVERGKIMRRHYKIGWDTTCVACHQVFPCQTMRLVHDLDTARQEPTRLRAIVSKLFKRMRVMTSARRNMHEEVRVLRAANENGDKKHQELVVSSNKDRSSARRRIAVQNNALSTLRSRLHDLRGKLNIESQAHKADRDLCQTAHVDRIGKNLGEIRELERWRTLGALDKRVRVMRYTREPLDQAEHLEYVRMQDAQQKLRKEMDKVVDALDEDYTSKDYGFDQQEADSIVHMIKTNIDARSVAVREDREKNIKYLEDELKTALSDVKITQDWLKEKCSELHDVKDELEARTTQLDMVQVESEATLEELQKVRKTLVGVRVSIGKIDKIRDSLHKQLSTAWARVRKEQNLSKTWGDRATLEARRNLANGERYHEEKRRKERLENALSTILRMVRAQQADKSMWGKPQNSAHSLLLYAIKDLYRLIEGFDFPEPPFEVKMFVDMEDVENLGTILPSGQTLEGLGLGEDALKGLNFGDASHVKTRSDSPLMDSQIHDSDGDCLEKSVESECHDTGSSPSEVLDEEVSECNDGVEICDSHPPMVKVQEGYITDHDVLDDVKILGRTLSWWFEHGIVEALLPIVRKVENEEACICGFQSNKGMVHLDDCPARGENGY